MGPAIVDNPKECGEEIKEAAAGGLMFASARCGELPELLDARAILADKFGRDFAAAAKEGAPGVVDPTLVRNLSGERASLEQQRRLAKEIAAENDILLEFPENPVKIHPVGRTASRINGQREREQSRNAPAREFVHESAAKTDRREVQRKQNPSLAQLSVDEKVSRESNKYIDARMAAEAAFASASFAAMAARASASVSWASCLAAAASCFSWAAGSAWSARLAASASVFFCLPTTTDTAASPDSPSARSSRSASYPSSAAGGGGGGGSGGMSAPAVEEHGVGRDLKAGEPMSPAVPVFGVAVRKKRERGRR